MKKKCKCGCNKVVSKIYVHGHNSRNMSNETKRKMSLAKKGHIVSDETRRKIGIKIRNRKHFDKTKLKIRKSLRKK